ncbi:MAG: enzyme repeat domain protein [Thermosipho sp. (in: Bacteria)]|jgi:hypothetical protein|nr:enzyme repeat domain protein [Thermosipho sp. (in: thermotogales)]
MKRYVIFLVIIIFLKIFGFNFNLFGHQGAIWQVKVFDNLLYTSASDGKVIIWDYKKLTIIKTIYSHNSWARALHIDDSNIYVGGYKPDNKLKIYDRRNGTLIKEIEYENGSIFTVTSNENFIAFSGSANRVYLVDKEKFNIVFNYKHDAWVRDIFFDGNLVYSCDEKGVVIVYDTSSFRLVKTLNFEYKLIKVVKFKNKIYFVSSNGYLLNENSIIKLTNSFTAAYSDSNKLIFGDKDGYIYFFDGKLKNKLRVVNDGILSISKCQNSIFISTSSGKLLKLDNNGTYRVTYFPNNFSIIKKTKIVENNLYVLKFDGTLLKYDLVTGKIIQKYYKISNFEISGSKFYIVNLKNQLLLDSNVLFESLNEITLILEFKDLLFIGTYEELFIFKDFQLFNYISIPNHWFISYETNNNKVLFGTSKGKVITYNIIDNNFNIEDFSDSPIVKILNGIPITFDGEIGKKYKLDTNIYDAVVFNSRIYLSTSKGVFSFSGNSINNVLEKKGLVFLESYNKKFYAIDYNGSIIIFDENFNEYGTLSEKHFIISKIDSYSDILVTTGGSKINIWKINGEKLVLLKTFEGHFDVIRDIKIIDKNRFVTASSDRTIKIWDFSGRLIKTLSLHSGYVWTLDFQNGLLFSGGWDGFIYGYDLNSGNVIFEKRFSSKITKIRVENNYLFLSFINGKIIRYDFLKDKQITLINTESTIWDFDIYKNYLVFGDENGICYIYNLKNEEIKKIHVHNSTIFSIKVLNDKIITGANDNSIKIIDFSGNVLYSYSNFKISVLSIAIDEKKNQIFLSEGEKPIVLQIP